MDPCQDLTDEDIRTAIQNATGPRNALFVPEVRIIIIVYGFFFFNFLLVSPNVMILDSCYSRTIHGIGVSGPI